MTPAVVTDPADPRLADYRNIRDRSLMKGPQADTDGGTFVAESEVVVRQLLASGWPVRSILLTAPRLRALDPALAGRDVLVLVVPQEIMNEVAGFPIHRGCLAIGERPREAQVPRDARLVVVLEDLVDVDNLGAMARNAAGFGADALLLSPRCADPFYRKAIRVSAGAVFTLPIVRALRWPEDLLALRERGLALVGAVLDPTAVPLPRWVPPARVALLLGSEGPGLSAETKRLCDTLVTIPMAKADSLNVSTAAAVCLYHLSQRR